ncbi:MAG TPA: hypothetical protein VLD39_09070 [Gammaproteobacteria bacterium]|nr:hypothetical protein [Gammaproteobacteria bacterium]
MAKPSLELVAALRETADRLERGVKFQWSHMGSCNCGHLAQTLTKLKPREIHSAALESVGDWTQQTRDYCPDSGLPLDSIIDAILAAGFTTVDLADLERLRAHEVLAAIPAERLPLDHRVREDAVLYMRTWADLLEKKWKRGMMASQTTERRELDPA